MHLLLDVPSLGRTVSWTSLQRDASAPYLENDQLILLHPGSHRVSAGADNFWRVDTVAYKRYISDGDGDGHSSGDLNA